jgi:hypothetical protein
VAQRQRRIIVAAGQFDRDLFADWQVEPKRVRGMIVQLTVGGIHRAGTAPMETMRTTAGQFWT